jgi:hypothetical protein
VSAGGASLCRCIKLRASRTSLALFIPGLGKAGLATEIAARRRTSAAEASAEGALTAVAGRAAEGLAITKGLAIAEWFTGSEAGLAAEIATWRTRIPICTRSKFATRGTRIAVSAWSEFATWGTICSAAEGTALTVAGAAAALAKGLAKGLLVTKAAGLTVTE